MNDNLNWRQTFGNGQAGDLLSEIVRHLYNQETKAGDCGIKPKQFATFSYYQVVTRITKAPICQECEWYND